MVVLEVVRPHGSDKHEGKENPRRGVPLPPPLPAPRNSSEDCCYQGPLNRLNRVKGSNYEAKRTSLGAGRADGPLPTPTPLRPLPPLKDSPPLSHSQDTGAGYPQAWPRYV